MATINNSSLTKEIIDGAKISIAYEKTPDQIADKVVPVMEVNPKLLRRCNYFVEGTASDATSGTIGTTPADKQVILTAGYLTYAKDVNATSLKIQLTVMVNNVEVNLLQMRFEPLTAGSDSIALSFPTPILVDKSSAIRIRSSTNVASIDITAGVIGYFVENSNV